MTTSFPPINYPNKPVPPFTAPAPRNPFPGFYPDMWRNITGKPYITVSSKGLANGLSEYINDGADFGPDSLQADGTLTQTGGVLDAINYCISNKITKIYVKGGIYYINAFADAGTSYGNPAYAGLPIPQVYSDGTQVALEIEGEGGYNWGYSSSANSSTIFYLKADASSTLPTSSDYIASIIKLVLPSGQSSGTNNLTGSYIFRNFIVRLDPDFLANSYCLGLSGIHAQDGANSFIMDNILIDVDGIGDNTTPTYPVPTYISGNTNDYINEGILFPAYSNYINNVHVTNSFVVYWQVGWYFDGDLIVLERCGHSYCNFGFMFSAAASTFWVIRDHFHQATPNLLGVQFSSPSPDQIVIFDNLQLYNVGQFGTYTPATDNNVLSGTMTWSSPQLNNTTNPLISTPFASGQGKYMKVTNLNIYTILPPTISANPPVSATVYQNTNPYDIEIDLPVYATTAGTAGYVTIAKGASSTPTAIGNQFVSGSTSSTSTDIIKLRVPAGWYYSFTGSGVTFATATPFAE